MKAPIALGELDEKVWQRLVVDAARTIGWRRIYHTHTSKHSQAGFPDLVLVRDRVIFLELKTEKGKLTDAQREWLTALAKAGAEVYVARPAQLDDLAKILATRKTLTNPLRTATLEELEMPAD